MIDSTDLYYQQIVNAMLTAPELAALDPANPSLVAFRQELNNPTPVGIHKLWAYITAWAIRNGILDSQERHEAEVAQLAAEAEWGTDAWIIKFLKAYQLGDVLAEVSQGRLGYQVLDSSKQIIKYVAVVARGGVAIIKVAKEVSGLPAPLSQGAPVESSEFYLVSKYLQRVMPPGSSYQLSSLPADTITLEGQVFYNGEVGEDVFLNTFQEAVKEFLKTGFAFNGVFRITDLLVYVKANVSGFKTWNLVFKGAKAGGTLQAFVMQYANTAGYCTFDIDSSTIDYKGE